MWIGRIQSEPKLFLLFQFDLFLRIKQKLRTGELSVAGDQWPVLLYSGYKFHEDDPWRGLLCSTILLKVVHVSDFFFTTNLRHFQTYKHIFTSPSSVEREAKATRSGNARIHGMTRVTPASIAYAATQVNIFYGESLLGITNYFLIDILQARFALSSSAVFTRSDTTTDSERFYNSVLDLLEDQDKAKEVDDLLVWWNRLVIRRIST